MKARKMVMITEPLGDMTGECGDGPKVLDAIGREMRSFDLCGRSWTDRPRDMADLLFNTLRPIFCSGWDVDVSLSFLADRIDWLMFDGSILTSVRSDLQREKGNWNGADLPSLLAICSEKACRPLLGKSMAQLFAYHIKRDDDVGEKAGLFLSELGYPSISLLSTLLHGDVPNVEVVLVPSPVSIEGRGMTFDVRGIPAKRAEEMRVDYVRRVHKELGCDKHSMW